jgi:hypothetical protein
MMKSVFFTLALILIFGQLMAQPGPGPDPDVPITGIEYLVGLGALLGIKKIMKSFSKEK